MKTTKRDAVDATPRQDKEGGRTGKGGDGNMADTRQPKRDTLQDLDLLV